MRTYPLPMVPGPVSLPPEVLAAMGVNFGSGDLEDEFFELYERTAAGLQTIMETAHPVVILSGEGMAGLWSALKSCLKPGDRVLSVATGLFGHGIADMAAAVGAVIRKVSAPDNETLSDFTEVAKVIEDFRPVMITAVHCETPSGTLNPLASLGALKKQLRVPLLYVDAVSSIGGTPVQTDAWNIDLCLGGAQKCLSAPPDTAFLSVSDSAWERIEEIDYVGYDALKPFRHALRNRFFPYTPNWHGIAALNAGTERIVNEGLSRCFARHDRVAGKCRQRIKEMGLKLFAAPDAVPSPTVTAIHLPGGRSWTDFDADLRRHGLVVGGSYGAWSGKVFRLGHMGTQADEVLVARALEVIADVLQTP